MKLFLRKYILVFLFSLSLMHSAQGQEKKPIFLGVQPGITQEKSYSDNEFDVNVFPLVFQTAMCKRFDIRLTSIVNYHSGGEENGFSDIGINIVAPFFFRNKEDVLEPSHGIYLGPVVGFGNNFLDEHATLTTALEGGYMFRADKKFTLALGMQLGGSYFIYDTTPDAWTNHFGIKINLGWWLRKNWNSRVWEDSVPVVIWDEVKMPDTCIRPSVNVIHSYKLLADSREYLPCFPVIL